MVRKVYWTRIFLGFLILGGLVAGAHAKTVEEILAEINRLAPERRQERLEEGAKREGSLKFYAVSNAVLLRSYTKGFMKKYPFIKAEFWRGSGAKLVVRAMLEHKTGNLDADVISVGAEHSRPMKDGGLWARYRSPEARFYPKDFYSESGYWHANHLGLSAIAYNSDMVKENEAPKGYEELLDPKWKGNISIDLEPERALSAWLVAWGEEKTRKFVRGLMRNEALIRRGHTLQAQLLCAGEFKIAVEIYPDAVARLRRQGCPAAIVFPNPTPGRAGGVMGIYVNTPHPHTAALFMDFILSEAGAEILSSTGRISARKGIQPLYEELSELEKKGVPLLVVPPEKSGELLEPMEKIMKEILVR